VAVLIVVSAAVVVSRRRYLIAGWLWYVVTLLPVSGLIPSGFEAMADRWTYVPMVGVSIAIAWGGAELAARSSRRAVEVGAAVVLAALVVTSWHQARYWRDSITLYEHSLAAAPDPAILHYNLANALDRKGRRDEAIRHYRRAVAIQPHY